MFIKKLLIHSYGLKGDICVFYTDTLKVIYYINTIPFNDSREFVIQEDYLDGISLGIRVTDDLINLQQNQNLKLLHAKTDSVGTSGSYGGSNLDLSKQYNIFSFDYVNNCSNLYFNGRIIDSMGGRDATYESIHLFGMGSNFTNITTPNVSYPFNFWLKSKLYSLN